MSYEPNKVPEEKMEREECDLVQVEKGLEDTTKILVEDFTKGRIDATMTMTGLQLVQDTREACARGDLEACGRLQLVKRFLERARKESAE
jgi:predicted methyltransferase MtxX (methanogen marker protein 4)